MSDKSTQKSLEQEILLCKKQLNELAPDIDFDEDKSKEYNKIIVRKAILVDRYKKLCYKPSLKQKIKEALTFKKREELICDYFLT